MCTIVTEELYKMHKRAIIDAVHGVLKKLVRDKPLVFINISNFGTMWNFDMMQHIILFFRNLCHGLIFCFFSSFQDQTESEEMTEQFERFCIAQSAGLLSCNQHILYSVILFYMFHNTHLKCTCEYITTWYLIGVTAGRAIRPGSDIYAKLHSWCQ